MIIAGDIGGTKTLLALFEPGIRAPRFERRGVAGRAVAAGLMARAREVEERQGSPHRQVKEDRPAESELAGERRPDERHRRMKGARVEGKVEEDEARSPAPKHQAHESGDEESKPGRG